MKKRVLVLLIGFFTVTTFAQAANNSATLQNAILKYKKGNYTGCIQDLENLTRSEQSNALAYYYLAIANVQAGKKDSAIEAYDKVLALKPNATLLDYATKGKICLEQPEYCYKNTQIKEEDTELDKFIKNKNQFVYKGAQTEKARTNLDSLKNRINSGEEITSEEFKEIERASQNTTKPSNDEIANAIKVLNNAGLTSITNQHQTNTQKNNNVTQEQLQQIQQTLAQMQQQINMNSMGMNSQYNDIQMLLNNNKNSNNSANNFMNMLPFIMAQSNQGQNGEKTNINPEILQTVMMNSMMPDLNFSTSDK